MKVKFIGINAKYIHTCPSIRILNKIVKEKYDSSFLEFTIKDNIDHIIDTITKDCDVLSFSCYIWNIELIKELTLRLKKEYPHIILVAGGPEVSYDVNYYKTYFNYIIKGEGENAIITLLDKINNKENPKSIEDSLTFFNYVDDLNAVPDILDEYSEDDIKNRIIYVETNRGCPFKCSYCLSSLEKDVRFFSDEYQVKLINWVKSHKFRCIKFLDRSFNINPKRLLNIVNELSASDNIYQFEIEPNLLTDEVVEYFANTVIPNKFRLEIGFQTFNNESLKAVNRIQNNSKVVEAINKINKNKRCTIHIDLIAGLPYEDLSSFKDTFNKTFILKCEELQLGFLKMLRGTKIRNEASLYDYKYQSKAPYEVISNKFISKEELDNIRQVEDALEWMWNDKRCANLINHLMDDNVIDSFYEFFNKAYLYVNKVNKLEDKYKKVLDLLKDIGIYKKEYEDDLKLDYLSKMLINPSAFWLNSINNKIPYKYKDLGLDNSYSNSFITDYYDGYLIIKYPKDQKPVIEIKKGQTN